MCFNLLTSHDYRSVIRFAAQLAAVGDPTARRDVLTASAIQLVNGSSAVLGVASLQREGLALRMGATTFSGFSNPKAIHHVLASGEYQRNPIIKPSLTRLAARPWAVAIREEIFSDERWHRFSYVKTVNRTLDVGHSIYAACRMAVPGQVLCMGVFRPWEEKSRFQPADAERLGLLMEFAHGAARGLQGDLREAAEEGLSTRLRQTLRGLMAGQSEKEIARSLGLGKGTVHHYVTMLYRRFSVHSARELMAALQND